MKFYYTGSTTYNGIQKNSNLSIGGFLSSSEVQNDLVNNIFGDISELSKQNLSRQTVLIALKNNHNEIVQSVILKFNVSDWSILTSEFNIAFVASKIDNCGNIYFDSIDNQEALPYLDFEVISSTNNEFSLGDLDRDAVIGIWLVRKIKKSGVAPLSCDTIYNNYLNSIEESSTENFSISLEWSDDESGSISS